MWVVFDAVKLAICCDNDDGSVSVDFVKASDEELERARLMKTRPLIAKVLDIDDVTHEIRQTWDDCLVAGKDEATAQAMVAKMFGKLWAYGGFDGDKGPYPPRFEYVEVPDSMTFGCLWITDSTDGPPRAVQEA
jgi:hypothetical protein